MSSDQQCNQEFLLHAQSMILAVSKDVDASHEMAQHLSDRMEPKWLDIYRLNGPSILILSEYLLTQGAEQAAEDRQIAAKYPLKHTTSAEHVRGHLDMCKTLCASIIESMQTKQIIDNISICHLWYELQCVSKFIFTTTPHYLPGGSPLASLNGMPHINDIRKAVDKFRRPVTPDDLICTEYSAGASKASSPSPNATTPRPPTKPAPMPLNTDLVPLLLASADSSQPLDLTARPEPKHTYGGRTNSRGGRTLTWVPLSPEASPKASRSRSPRY